MDLHIPDQTYKDYRKTYAKYQKLPSGKKLPVELADKMINAFINIMSEE